MLMKYYTKRVDEKGFTLIELLVVMGILAILMAIVLIAVNPARQFKIANDTSRANAVNQILNGVGQYETDHKGAVPPGITASPQLIEKTGGVDLCTALTPTYLPSLPQDPGSNGGANITDCTLTYNTGYSISVDANNRVTVSAVPEIQTAIEVTR